jgi:hypothetical protein
MHKETLKKLKRIVAREWLIILVILGGGLFASIGFFFINEHIEFSKHQRELTQWEKEYSKLKQEYELLPQKGYSQEQVEMAVRSLQYHKQLAAPTTPKQKQDFRDLRLRYFVENLPPGPDVPYVWVESEQIYLPEDYAVILEKAGKVKIGKAEKLIPKLTEEEKKTKWIKSQLPYKPFPPLKPDPITGIVSLVPLFFISMYIAIQFIRSVIWAVRTIARK